MSDLLTTAVAFHRAGQWEPAARLYHEVLAQDESNADVLHLIGVLSHQRGDHVRAIEWIGRAIALQAGVPAFHSNLAEAHRALGQWAEAAESCRAALQLRPDYPEALCNLGLCSHALGFRFEAIEQFRHALQLRPDNAAVHNNLGIVLRELGRDGEAVEHFQTAIAQEPDFAPPRTNLGQWLLDRGRNDEALVHCQEAVRLEPDLAAMHHNLGNVLRVMERLDEARGAYLEAVRLNPDLAEAHARLGAILRRERQPWDALPWLKNAVRLEPDNAAFWEFLAEAYAEVDEFAEAIPCWERVLELAPVNLASHHRALGTAFQHEGRFVEAGERYRTALVLQPNLAAAHVDLGWLHEELGDFNISEAAYRAALKLRPKFPLPIARLATLLRGDLPDDDLKDLESRLDDPDLLDRGRANLLFGLAHVLDGRGEYPRAADCARQANEITLNLEPDRRAYSPVDHAQFVDGLMQTFNAAFFTRLGQAGLETHRPVFIVGLPRSGTTLLEQVLASHPQVYGAGELNLARRSFESVPATVGRPGPTLSCASHLDADSVRRIAERHIQSLNEKDENRFDRIVDKMPDNVFYLGLLAVMFPNAVFIHCRRDLRDIAVSCWMTHFTGIRWANSIEHIATRFREYVRLVDHWRSVLPVTLHEVDYEETVTDLERVARRLLSACGLPWDPACLEFHRTRRVVRTASITQVRRPVYQKSVARWRRYENSLANLFAALPPEPRERS